MEFKSFTAPSIPSTNKPKLSKKTISSPLMRGALNLNSATQSPKLRVSKFSFLGKKEQNTQETLKLEASTGLNENTSKVEETLIETNNILVEIQKQLSFDFAMRVAEEKELIKKIRTEDQKRKVSEEENRLEGLKKVDNKVKGIFSKITAPAKSIFDKIKEFFGILLAGIVTSKAFEWLKDENNRTTLDTIFQWISKLFVPVLIAVVGYKAFKWLRRIFRVARWFWRLPGRLIGLVTKIGRWTGIIKGGSKAGTTATQVSKTATATVDAAMKAKNKAAIDQARKKLAEEILNKNLSYKATNITLPSGGRAEIQVTREAAEKLLSKANWWQKSMNAIGGAWNKMNSWMDDLTKKIVEPIIKFVLPNLPAPVQRKVTQAVVKKGFKRFLPYANMLFAVPEAIGRAMSGDVEGALLSAAGAIPIVGWGALALDIYRSVDPEGYTKNIRRGMEQEDMDNLILDGLSAIGEFSATGYGAWSKGGTIPGNPVYASSGMTVHGRGSGFIDSVRAMLAPGEEVIRTTSAMLFRPLLKDINDNAGRLWKQFSQAVRKLFSLSDEQLKVSQEFSKVLTSFENSVKKAKQDELLEKSKNARSNDYRGGFGNLRMSGMNNSTVMSNKTNFKPRPNQNIKISNLNQNSGGNMTVLPMILPEIAPNPPTVPEAPQIPESMTISSVDELNPYPLINLDLYGIMVV